jgi:diguanylate cyclase (GGDEF)-like protein/PAS domain S-box-containing protein
MPKYFFFQEQWMHKIHRVLNQVLYGFSTYALSILIGLVSFIALLFWDTNYPTPHAQQLNFRALVQQAALEDPAQALAELGTQAATTSLDTHLSEQPVWLSFSVPASLSKETSMVDFPSRHAVEISCWDAQSMALLGQGNRQETKGLISVIKAGFALSLGRPATDTEVLCRATFIGPARISIIQMPGSELMNADHQFHRNSGLLDGGLTLLALFVLVTALINREGNFVLFATWLLVNLRMGALSAGWDTQWLGHRVPQDWILTGRLVTTALYYLLTITLFKAIFRDELKKVGYATLLRISQWSCLPLLILSFTLSYKDYLPFLWVASTYSIAVVGFFLYRIVDLTRSSVAVWYIASLGVTLFAGLSEVIAASIGIKPLIGSVNSVTAALASSLLASLAIAEQMRREHKQRLEVQAELRHTYDAMPIGLFTLDQKGRFMSTNPALRKMLGQRGSSSKYNSWQQYFGADVWHQLYQLVQQQDDGELEIQSQLDVTGKEAPRRFLIKAAMANGKIEGSLQDVTERSIATEELNFLANNDSLTKVLNRRGIELVFSSAMARFDSDHPLALAYLDLDRFKLINDLFGHNAGDEVLKQVCARITSLLSGGMQMGRVGGDEFVIVLPDTRMPLATVICRGIIDSIDNTPYRVGEKAFHVRGSIGLIEIGQGTTLKEALSTSDRACREAKTGQHKGLVVYERDAPAFQEHEAEIRLIERLSSSETIEGLFVEMQPIMSLTRPNDSLNFEVLLRMRDQHGKLIPVSRVIAAGEHSGRMSVIDRWVLSTTLAWLDKNRARLKNTQFICINLSGASLNDEEFVQEVFDLLRRNSHVVSFLSIEITESVALHDLQNTRRFIDKVRAYGARVALDDFGAGYTSFSYLKDLPADLLKIDGSFVVNMNQHPANVSIVEAIVNLAKNLGMKTIAEWAEDTATVQTLAEIGVDYVQGFVVARPMAPEKLLEAKSAASFIKDEELLQFVTLIEQSADPMTQIDLMLQDNSEISRKIH